MGFKRIKPSEKDCLVLQKLMASRKATEGLQPKRYKNCVVIKPWGYEYLIFENEHVAVWLLKIHNGHSTSMHCHPLKKTSLILLVGQALCNTFRRRNYLTALTGLIIEKSVFHSAKALSSDGIELIEVETPPNKTDLVRFNDSYGRKGLGYEGFAEMETQDLRRFNHFYFEEPLGKKEQTHFSEKYSISVEAFFDNEHFQNSFQINDKEIYGVCKGRLLHSQDSVLLDVGDIALGGDLKKVGALKINERTVLLKAREKKHENN